MSVLAIISKNCPAAAAEKLSKNFETFRLPADPQLAPPVAHHPDMLIVILDGKLFCHQEYYRLAHQVIDKILELCKLKLICTDTPRAAKYPSDVGLNALILPDRQQVIARRSSLASELLPYLAADTKQGYAGCSTLYIGGTLVTADPSICSAGEQIGIPIYKVPGGDIQLMGYNTGFIGGCGGIWKDTVYIYGRANSCDTGHALLEFCRKKKFLIVELWDGPLSDFGGIQFIETMK